MKSKCCFILLALIGWLAGGCSEERWEGQPSEDFEEGELVEVSLCLSVNPLQVELQADTRAVEDTEAERAVHNIWVCQFDAATGNRLINPRYYTIEDQNQLKDLPVYLRLNEVGEESVICIVANVGEEIWPTDQTIANQETWENLELIGLNPQFVQEGTVLSIPMEGSSNKAQVTETSVIMVPLTRMFAKVMVTVDISREDMTLRNIETNNMSTACLVRARTGSEGDKTDYSGSSIGYWHSTVFDDVDPSMSRETPYTVYMAENMQGNYIANGENATDHPAQAYQLVVETVRNDPTSGEQHYNYAAYPRTGNAQSDEFNIKRNCVYQVNIHIRDLDELPHTPSSNCFIVKTNTLMSFEPYYRIETGGGYNFKDYLDADDETGEKVIDHVGILWQTKDAIGNTKENPSLVRYDAEEQKIYVQTGSAEGNALIAAYNKNGTILWSWHIWVTNNDPGNLSKAIRYTTYRWDNEKIYYNAARVPGYQVMSCNLGALADEPSGPGLSDNNTYGMLYQWGRKDPFPPMRNEGDQFPIPYNTIDSSPRDYTQKSTGSNTWDYTNEELVGMTNTEDSEQMFCSVASATVNNLDNPIVYTIQHPTHFLCANRGTPNSNQDVSTVNNQLVYNGDWCAEKHDDKLWGGLQPVTDGTIEYYTVGTAYGNDMHIFDNYGTEKSIFDPCPYGWRVPPGELWLGFSFTGVNTVFSPDYINYDSSKDNYLGLYMYMISWQSGAVSFFPTQGLRIASGSGVRTGLCGNYHNATADTNDRVNILHMHNGEPFRIFENSNQSYYAKSVAGPIRCVRDRL